MVSLKIINAIRNEIEVPLQHLREVKRRLPHLGEDMWAKTTLYVLDRRVIFYNPDIDKNEDISGQLVLDEIPLKVVSGDMQKAVRSLRERAPETVGKIIKQRGTAANKPVIAGTRIPVKSIKAFSDAGYSIEQIREQYPILTEEDIRAALASPSRPRLRSFLTKAFRRLSGSSSSGMVISLYPFEEVVARGSKDELVCIAAEANEALLVAFDNDMKQLARRHGVTAAHSSG